MKRTYKMISLMLALCMLFSLGTISAMAEAASPIYSMNDLFSSRDLTQTADLSEAAAYTVTDGQDIHITAAGIYVLTGTASNATVYVEAGKEERDQFQLPGDLRKNRRQAVRHHQWRQQSGRDRDVHS